MILMNPYRTYNKFIIYTALYYRNYAETACTCNRWVLFSKAFSK